VIPDGYTSSITPWPLPLRNPAPKAVEPIPNTERFSYPGWAIDSSGFSGPLVSVNSSTSFSK
jgi:hypothetical protein